jgi:hypothetical protein
VIGGLITSTFLSLLVIPVLFTYVDDVVQRFGRLFKHKHHHDEEQPPASAAAAAPEKG